jgi:hypothetical protein
MATLYITEFSSQARDGSGAVLPAALLPPLAEQTVAIAGASAQSAALQPGTNFVRVSSDVVCSIKVGANPMAAATNMRLAAGAVEYFAVLPAQSMKIAVISNT